MKTAFVVLGMHRSGTSSVAGALVQLGAVAPASLMEPKPENPKGFWESEAIMLFNDRLLTACGSAWNDWRWLDTTNISGLAGAVFRQEASDLLTREFAGSDRIVLKDPRICRLFQFWSAVLASNGYRPLVIFPIRDPGEVAASLASRNGTPPSDGLRLWMQHVLSAEHQSRGYARHFMSWDDFLSDWRAQVGLMEARLMSPFNVTAETDAAVTAFLAPELKRHRDTTAAVPALISETLASLMLMARAGEDSRAVARLDMLRAAFCVNHPQVFDIDRGPSV